MKSTTIKTVYNGKWSHTYNNIERYPIEYSNSRYNHNKQAITQIKEIVLRRMISTYFNVPLDRVPEARKKYTFITNKILWSKCRFYEWKHEAQHIFFALQQHNIT